MSLIDGVTPSRMKALSDSLYFPKAAMHLNKQLKIQKAPSRIEKVTTRRNEHMKNLQEKKMTEWIMTGILITLRNINKLKNITENSIFNTYFIIISACGFVILFTLLSWFVYNARSSEVNQI